MAQDAQHPSPQGTGNCAHPPIKGVPETALLTLYLRAAEARKPGSLLPDPMALKILSQCDYPFQQRFGRPSKVTTRILALRTLAFDEEVRRFLTQYPHGTVVSLGEGLDTQFWRVDNGQCRWLTVDLPEMTALRNSLLPRENRQQTMACSVLDPHWASCTADLGDPVLIVAQGLCMYLRPAEVTHLITLCARSFPGGTLVFDMVPRWCFSLSAWGMLRCGPFRPPRMHSHLNPRLLSGLQQIHPAICAVQRVLTGGRRGLLGKVLYSLLARVMLTCVRLTFSPLHPAGRT
ncbi:class I SAM-dependent methyltransferase [Streptomyces sp. NPDC055796]